MTRMQRWIVALAFVMMLMPVAFADLPTPPPGVTSTYETVTAQIYLKGRSAVLPLSRNYQHLFRQM